ncbi:MAG: EAL domain-containing protein [Bauldia sp.]
MKRPTIHLSLIVALPAALILAGAFGTVLLSLSEMAGTVNRIEQTLTKRSAEAAVNAVVARMAETHGDYAEWDDAARKLYGVIDQRFVDENFVSSTMEPVFFDTVYLIDEQGRDLFAYRDGESVAIPSAQAFGPVLADMIAELPAESGAYDVRAGLVKTRWGLAVMAVGPVVPFLENFSPPSPEPRYLVLSKAFDAQAVSRLGDDYVIDGLALAEPSVVTDAAIDLTGPDGNTVAALTWSPRQLGSRAHARVSPPALAMLALLGTTLVLLIVIALRGIAKVQRGEAQARFAATHDPLTGLPNRTVLVQALETAIPATRRGRSPVAVVYLDLDGFKEVNDTYGHGAGDHLLRKVSAGFSGLCGKHLLVRVGGDEFAVVVAQDDAARIAADVGEQLVRYFARPFDVEGHPITIGASVGIAVVDSIGLSVEEVLRRADVAMYLAKHQGRNRVCVFDRSLDATRLKRTAIATDLRRALAADELTLAYQPIYDARGSVVVGVEALLRWPRPDRDPIPPGEFIPIAEETGLIDELGAWTLRRACRDALAWPGIKVSVNVSPAQFHNQDFGAVVSAILAEVGLSPKRLEIEVTETYFTAHPEQARAAIDAVRKLGVVVALDDFGTGYSSIGYLRRFAFDKLKLDRTLIAGIDTDRHAQQLVQATIALADALNLTVTAEGVETEGEAALLRLAGCDEFQGYFFGAPCPAAEITALLAGTPRRDAPVSLARSA